METLFQSLAHIKLILDKVIMKFSANGPNSNEYLVTNRPYKGKTLNIRAGHTTGFTEAEKKIFLSSILWLLYEI